MSESQAVSFKHYLKTHPYWFDIVILIILVLSTVIINLQRLSVWQYFVRIKQKLQTPYLG
jgi:hypothetical protein